MWHATNQTCKWSRIINDFRYGGIYRLLYDKLCILAIYWSPIAKNKLRFAPFAYLFKNYVCTDQKFAQMTKQIIAQAPSAMPATLWNFAPEFVSLNLVHQPSLNSVSWCRWKELCSRFWLPANMIRWEGNLWKQLRDFLTMTWFVNHLFCGVCVAIRRGLETYFSADLLFL